MCTEVFHHPLLPLFLVPKIALKTVAQNQVPAGELPCPNATTGKKREIMGYSPPRAHVSSQGNPWDKQGQLRDGTDTDPEANRAQGSPGQGNWQLNFANVISALQLEN